MHFAETHLAEAVATTGRDGFAVSLVALVGGAVAHDAAALLLFRDPQPPAVLVDRLKPGERQYLYSDYLSGVYLLSPFHRAAKGLKHSVATRVKDVAPPGFTVSEYHRRYFSRIGVSDMLGLLLPCGDGTALFLSLSRSVGRFGPAETRNVSALLPVIDALVTRHIELAGPFAPKPAPRKPQTKNSNGLTARESQVVTLILEGHSSLSLAAKLGISHETVRVHRRNIYAKLQVSSQAGLFHWFLASRAP